MIGYATSSKLEPRHNPDMIATFSCCCQSGLALEKNGWHMLADIKDSKDFIFTFQSPWQRQMLYNYGSNIVMVDLNHNTANNYVTIS
jgi:hypothetical protein